MYIYLATEIDQSTSFTITTGYGPLFSAYLHQEYRVYLLLYIIFGD
jgi:hypothetical protein